jgi:hypothetical protein
MSVKGEKYASKKAAMKHEKSEGPAARKKEYGSAKKGMFFSKASAAKAKKSTMNRKKGM